MIQEMVPFWLLRIGLFCCCFWRDSKEQHDRNISVLRMLGTGNKLKYEKIKAYPACSRSMPFTLISQCSMLSWATASFVKCWRACGLERQGQVLHLSGRSLEVCLPPQGGLRMRWASWCLVSEPVSQAADRLASEDAAGCAPRWALPSALQEEGSEVHRGDTRLRPVKPEEETWWSVTAGLEPLPLRLLRTLSGAADFPTHPFDVGGPKRPARSVNSHWARPSVCDIRHQHRNQRRATVRQF